MDAERRARGLYWDRAWKLVEGCTKVSAGCDHCWSEVETVMRAGHPNAAIGGRAQMVVGDAYPDLAPHFNGRILLREDSLVLPLRTKKPTVWAIWNDLFHEDVPIQFILSAYEEMSRCPQHTFLVLTKRSERLAAIAGGSAVACIFGPNYWPENVWHGVTIENQQAADERIPLLLRVPGKRFVSIEPILESIPFPFVTCKNCGGRGWIDNGELDQMLCLCNLNGAAQSPLVSSLAYIHAVLLGGESGKNSRPINLDWVRSVRDQCEFAGVPFFFKQGSGFRPGKLPLLDGVHHADLPWDGRHE